MNCRYCNSPMPEPNGARYTPCAKCGKAAITVYSDTQGGQVYRFVWRNDASDSEVVRLPGKLARAMKKPGVIKMVNMSL